MKEPKEHRVDGLVIGAYYIKPAADRYINWQKYKRCLAMANAMDKLMFALELQGKSVEIGLRHTKAMNRKYKWLELAEHYRGLL